MVSVSLDQGSGVFGGGFHVRCCVDRPAADVQFGSGWLRSTAQLKYLSIRPRLRSSDWRRVSETATRRPSERCDCIVIAIERLVRRMAVLAYSLRLRKPERCYARRLGMASDQAAS